MDHTGMKFLPLPQPIKAGTRFTDPGGMQGKVDLLGLRKLEFYGSSFLVASRDILACYEETASVDIRRRYT